MFDPKDLQEATQQQAAETANENAAPEQQTKEDLQQEAGQVEDQESIA